MPSAEDLKKLQELSLEQKVEITKQLIKEWYEYWKGEVYVSFSGGKDSTVLLNVAREVFPDIEAVYIDTGLEYPEIKKAIAEKENVTILKPQKTIQEILTNYGYPIISKKNAMMLETLQNPTPTNLASRILYETGVKRDGTLSKSFKLPQKWLFLKDAPFKISSCCCKFLKKEPLKRYHKKTGKKPIIATMTCESDMRLACWYKTGSNSYTGNVASRPLSFWDESDVLRYTQVKNIKIPACYGEIIETPQGLTTSKLKRTGCMFCMFGIQQEKEPNRFQKMELSHPDEYKYCMEDLGIKNVMEYLNIPYQNKYIEIPLF